MRAIVLLIAANLAFISGCVEADAAPVAAVPEELLVRVYLDDGQAVVRLAGLIDQTEVVPFDGDVEIVLMPQGRCNWHPTTAAAEVQKAEFHEAVLPYFETAIPLHDARVGDAVTLRAEAILDDGTMIRGAHATVF